MFVVGAVVSIGSAIIFILFGSGQVQKWNDVEVKEINETQKEPKYVPINDK